MSESVRESIVVSADPSTVFDVVADFERYPEWQDEIRAVEVLDTDAQGRGTKVWFRVDAKLLQMTYTLAYTYSGAPAEDSATMSWELVEGDQVSELVGAYHLEGRGDGSTEITYELAVTPKVALPGIVRRQAARRIVDGALKGVRQRAEGG